MNVNFSDLSLEQISFLRDNPVCTADLESFCTGRFGKGGLRTCIVQLEFFKNGKIKRSSYNVVTTLNIIKSPVRYGNARISERIKSICFIDNAF